MLNSKIRLPLELRQLILKFRDMDWWYYYYRGIVMAVKKRSARELDKLAAKYDISRGSAMYSHYQHQRYIKNNLSRELDKLTNLTRRAWCNKDYEIHNKNYEDKRNLQFTRNLQPILPPIVYRRLLKHFNTPYD